MSIGLPSAAAAHVMLARYREYDGGSRQATTAEDYTFLGANMMIAIPTNATKDPAMSQAVGLIPSTAHSHRIATKMYAPP